VGSILEDTAVLSGGLNPTGTITFTLYGPTDGTCTSALYTVVVTVNGNGSYTTVGTVGTGSNVAAFSGTYHWAAVYSGDANNNSASSPCSAEPVTINFHPGTIGFWRNWRNHYSDTQFNLLLAYLQANNPDVYGEVGHLVTIQIIDAIFDFGKKTPREQMVLGQLTALKLNLAITQLDGSGGLVQKNDDICLAGVVDVSGIAGATAFFGTSTPTVDQVVDAVEGAWDGTLTTNRNNWSFNLTNGDLVMFIEILTGINEGTAVMNSGC
jgi:hypothetical protein